MDKFAFFHKWFWVGAVISILSGPAGLVYGLALAFEPERKKEGIVLIVASVIWALIIGTVILLFIRTK